MSAENIPRDIIHQKRFEVTEDMVAKGIGLDVQVLSTPALILAMELTAHEAISKYLSEEESTVGGGICISHLRPTRLGEHFEVVVRLKRVERNKIVFQIEAFDPHAKIAEGEHVRYVINKNKFKAKVEGRHQ
ncbi:MAG: thioesterase family protein [Euryarchaeota archaeon]|nr:thioesterase family protein [Euryarchaeota archaeon]